MNCGQNHSQNISSHFFNKTSSITPLLNPQSHININIRNYIKFFVVNAHDCCRNFWYKKYFTCSWLRQRSHKSVPFGYASFPSMLFFSCSFFAYSFTYANLYPLSNHSILRQMRKQKKKYSALTWHSVNRNDYGNG